MAPWTAPIWERSWVTGPSDRGVHAPALNTMPLGDSAQAIAERLSLAPHPEGGWYRELHREGAMTSILFLLDAGMESRWHRLNASEAWYWHAGGEIELELHDPGSPRATLRLGMGEGASLQAFVPPYAWQRAKAIDRWCLVGCAVTPAFDFSRFEMAPPEWTPESPDPRFDPLLEKAIRELGAESGSVHLLASDRVLHLICSRGIPEPVRAIVRRVPVGKGMAGLAVERREPVSACNIQTDQSGDVRPGAKATGLEGAVVVPILDEGGAAVGALGVANRSPRAFTPAETSRLTEIGREVARARLGA